MLNIKQIAIKQGYRKQVHDFLYRQELKIARRLDQEKNKIFLKENIYFKPIQANGCWAESYEPSIAAALYITMIKRTSSSEQRILALERLKEIVDHYEGTFEPAKTKQLLCALAYKLASSEKPEQQKNDILIFRKVYKQGNPRLVKKALTAEGLSIAKKNSSTPIVFDGSDPDSPTEKILKSFIFGESNIIYTAQEILNKTELSELFKAAEILRIKATPAIEVNDNLFILENIDKSTKYEKLFNNELKEFCKKVQVLKEKNIEKMIKHFNDSALTVINTRLNKTQLKPIIISELKKHYQQEGCYALSYGHLYEYTYLKIKSALKKYIDENPQDQETLNLLKKFSRKECHKYYNDIKKSLQIPPPYQKIQFIKPSSAMELIELLK